MRGKHLNITFIPGKTLILVHTPILVLHHYMKKVKQNLVWDISLGIIEPVPVGTPATRCSRIMVAPKNDGTT